MADPAAPSASIVLNQAIGADVWSFGSNGTLIAGVPASVHREECAGRAIGEVGQGKDGALSLRTLEASGVVLGWVRNDVYELAIE